MIQSLEEIALAILANRDVRLTEGQAHALSAFSRFHHSIAPQACFIMEGAAGSGKTFMINLYRAALERMGYKSALLAPTGRAAKVVSRRTRRYASTIHRYIYSPVEHGTGSITFALKENRDPDKMYYIVDEASMIGDADDPGRRSLLGELLEFIYGSGSRRRLILVGDSAQLPPVGGDISPALDPAWMRKKYGLTVGRVALEEILRQQAGSEILRVAGAVRAGIDQGAAPSIQPEYGGEVEYLDNGQEALELFTGLYDPDNTDNALFITYSNRMAVEVNRAIRHHLFETEADLIPGEVLMVVRNNYAWGNRTFPFIANGEMGVVREVLSDAVEEKYGHRWADAIVEFTDLKGEPVEFTCKLLLDLLDDPRPQLGYNDMQHITVERRRLMEEQGKTKQAELLRKDPYVNALQVKYGYAVTGHKAQGGQWRYVIAAFEPMYKGMSLRDYLRWTYTVLTRAEERIWLLGFPFTDRSF